MFTLFACVVCAEAVLPHIPLATVNGEFEGAEYWEEKGLELRKAWEKVSPLHPELYHFDSLFITQYLSPEFVILGEQLRGGHTNETALRTFFEEVIPGVWLSPRLFSPLFSEHLVEELTHLEETNIPIRRPNGMNRHGAILESVDGGIVSLAPALNDLIQWYLRPITETLLPEVVGQGDADDHFAFTIRYKLEEDVSLSEHRDASVATINLCLGKKGFEGGQLYFVPNASQPSSRSSFQHVPGSAVIHRGSLRHGSEPLVSGERTNLIIWLFGQNGDVRFADYPVEQRMKQHQRWKHHEL